MPDFVIEQAGGRLTTTDIQGASNTTIPFIVILENLQTASEVAAFNALNNPSSVPNTMPAEYDGQRRVAVRMTERVRIGVYRFEVDYEIADSEKSEDDEKVVDEWTVSFDTKGATQNKNRSDGSTFYWRDPATPTLPGANPVDDNAFNNLIGLNADDETLSAAGADIVIPQLRLNIDVKLSRTTFTMAYINKVKTITGKVNDKAFPPTKGGFFDENFEAGEVLCLGVTGTSRKAGETTIGIAFAIEENQTNLLIAPERPDLGLTPLRVAKKGWQHVWTWDEKMEVTIAALGKKYMVPIPTYAMVEDMYPSGDFDILGLT